VQTSHLLLSSAKRDPKTGRFLRVTGFKWSHHPLYTGYLDMFARCNNPNNDQYKDYGGRGIRVCERWNNFQTFVADVGKRPRGKTLDRIDNDGHYEPGNCKWSTKKEQSRNSRRNVLLTFEGRTQIAIDWASELGINISTLYKRLNASGWDAATALGTLALTKSQTGYSSWERRSRKVTDSDVVSIRAMRVEGATYKQIADRFHIGGEHARRICLGMQRAQAA
jgi:hypothetical protein